MSHKPSEWQSANYFEKFYSFKFSSQAINCFENQIIRSETRSFWIQKIKRKIYIHFRRERERERGRERGSIVVPQVIEVDE